VSRGNRVALVLLLGGWGLSWLFARDIVKGLEHLGILPKRGLVLSDESDFTFSLGVLAGMLALWALWRVATALGGRVQPAPAASEEDPRYLELERQKEQLLRELKDLEFDRDLRKISPEDYGMIERRLRREATSILRALDEVDPVRLYGDRIREDLKRFLDEPAERAAAPGEAAGAAWRREILARPAYRELAPLLGERDLLLAALRDLWIREAEVDRDNPAASVVTVEDRRSGEEFTCTLAELRSRVLRRLADGDDAEAVRLAEIAGCDARQGSPREVRARALEALSRELDGAASV
jgi:hypothetical protein